MSEYITYNPTINALNICATGLATTCCSSGVSSPTACCISGIMYYNLDTIHNCATGIFAKRRWLIDNNSTYTLSDQRYGYIAWEEGACCVTLSPQSRIQHSYVTSDTTRTVVSGECDSVNDTNLYPLLNLCTYDRIYSENHYSYYCNEVGDGCSWGLRGSPMQTDSSSYEEHLTGQIFDENIDISIGSSGPQLGFYAYHIPTINRICGPTWSTTYDSTYRGIRTLVQTDESISINQNQLTYSRTITETITQLNINFVSKLRVEAWNTVSTVTEIEAC